MLVKFASRGAVVRGKGAPVNLPPLREGALPLALSEGVLRRNLVKGHEGHPRIPDDGRGLPVVVEDNAVAALARQRLALRLIGDERAGRRRLDAREDERGQLVGKWPAAASDCCPQGDCATSRLW